MSLRNLAILLLILSNSAQISCKREDDGLSTMDKAKNNPSSPSPGPVNKAPPEAPPGEPEDQPSENNGSGENGSGDLEGFLPNPPEGNDIDYTVHGVDYALSTGYQNLGCQKFKSFAKNATSFGFQHSPMPLFSENGVIVKENLCAISGEFILPAGHVVNMVFRSMPVASEILLEDGDSFAFTYDLLYQVNGKEFTRSYVGTTNGPYDGLKDVSLDSRRVLEMGCQDVADEDRQVNFAIKLEGQLWPNKNVDSNGKFIIGYVLISPDVEMKFVNCN